MNKWFDTTILFVINVTQIKGNTEGTVWGGVGANRCVRPYFMWHLIRADTPVCPYMECVVVGAGSSRP